MLNIQTSLYLNQCWSQIQCFQTKEERVLLVIMYKRDLLGCIQVSLQDVNWKPPGKEYLQIVENNIIGVHYVNDQIFVLDEKGAIFCYKYADCSLDKISTFSCDILFGSCFIPSNNSIVCLSSNNAGKMTVHCYNCETKTVKSCAFVKPKDKTSSKYTLRYVPSTNSSDVVLIGCPDGSVVKCSDKCTFTEVIHQCEAAVVDIFQEDDVTYFVQTDGCLLEYSNHQVSSKYLPQCIPKHCRFASPNLVYSDGRSAFAYDLNEESVQELTVKGVIDICLVDSRLFLLTIQGMLYVLQDNSTSDEFLSKLNQFDSLNSQLDQVNLDLQAINIFTRAEQLKCRFLTKLCITEGELDKAYKVRLDLTHTCEDLTFDKTVWSCLCIVDRQYVVLPLSESVLMGSTVQMSFVLTQFELISHVSLKIYLISGSNSELRVPVVDSILTLFSFCSPVNSRPSNLTHTQSVSLNPEDCANILHRILMVIRHTFTKVAWDEVGTEKTVLLKYGKEVMELCADEKSRELLVKCTSEKVCISVAKIVQAAFFSAGFLYSDYLKLNNIKVDTEIEEYTKDSVDLVAMTKRVKELKSV